eukprot:1411243-Alexandrium_andersonii.AAC.1
MPGTAVGKFKRFWTAVSFLSRLYALLGSFRRSRVRPKAPKTAQKRLRAAKSAERCTKVPEIA